MLPVPSFSSCSHRPALQGLLAQQKPSSIHTDLPQYISSSFAHLLQSLWAGLVHAAGRKPTPARRCPGMMGTGSPEAGFSLRHRPRVRPLQGRNAASLTQKRTYQHGAQEQCGRGTTKFSSSCTERKFRKSRIDPEKVPNWHKFL